MTGKARGVLADATPELVEKRRRYKAYAEYVDSGVPWVGSIPKHWETLPMKWLGWFRAGAGFPDDAQGVTDADLPFFKVSDMNLYGNERFMVNCTNTVSLETARRLGAKVFGAGTIVFPKVGAALLLNKRRVLTSAACIDNNTMGFCVRDVDVDFIYYRMLTLDLGRLANPGAVPSINEGQLRNILLNVPPVPEQEAIAAFLDRETGKIDALVEKKRRLIKLLKEKLAALISHAVTKGLNPDVPMKDSGIEWLGHVPEHWQVAPLRRHWEVIDCKHRTVPFVDEGIPIASIGEVQGIEVDLSTAKRTVEDEFLQLVDGGRRPQWGDIIYSRNATVGAAAFVNTTERFCMGQDVCLIRSTDQDQRYLVYQLRTPLVLGQLDQIMVGATFKRINVADIKGLIVCCPPRTDQGEIARFCDTTHAALTRMVLKVEEAIARLLEYRTALISAAVTGKIDVRGEV